MERKGARRGKDTGSHTPPAPPRPPPPPAGAAAAPARKVTVSVPARPATPPAPPSRAADPARPAAAPPVLPPRPAPTVSLPAAAAAPRAARAPQAAPIIESHAGEAEHRHFPRARFSVPFELWRDGEDGERSFSASLRSVNVSVSGAFLESSFFLPMGTELRVRFALEEDAEPVEARALIVRELREATTSGFGVRFEEFFGQTEVALAKLFLGARLRRFSEEYLQSKRARGFANELERVVDALAAWELIKATSETDPWRGE